jgi:hypothetical protein
MVILREKKEPDLHQALIFSITPLYYRSDIKAKRLPDGRRFAFIICLHLFAQVHTFFFV